MAELKTGALSRADIQSVWEGSVDKSYRDSLVRAGEGRGFEAWTQLFAQFERASKAIDVTTQAMFIAPWSGQTQPPASGGRKATVTLTITRTKRLNEPLFLQRGLFVVEEQTTDFGSGKGVVVKSGRRYILSDDLYFAPGEQGPFEAVFEAERFGYGYNNPLPGTIRAIEQFGSFFDNDRSALVLNNAAANLAGVSSSATLVAWNQPDMPVPEHLGQYVLFVSGANEGRVGRMTLFTAPVPPFIGSSMMLDLFYAIGVTSVSGVFNKGDIVTLVNGLNTAYARVVDSRVVGGIRRLALSILNGATAALNVGATVTGPFGSATIFSMDYDSKFVAEAPVVGIGGGSWRILDWVYDWGMSATHTMSPSGGIAAFLDELGAERNIGRSPGEPDESYRARVREIADVVSPNAIRRGLNRVLQGLPWCLREVGQAGLQGMFFDGTNEPVDASPHGAANDAYDIDTYTFNGVVAGTFLFQEEIVLENPVTWESMMFGRMGRLSGSVMTFVRKVGTVPSSLAGWRIRGQQSGATFSSLAAPTQSPQFQARRYHVWLNYTEMRAFFLITVPPNGGGEFGFAYGIGGWDLSDAYDGYPYLAAQHYRRIYDVVEQRRAGGVGWELRIDGGSCP